MLWTLLVRQHAVRRFRRGKDAIDDLVGRRQAAALEPEDDVRPAGHRPDFDLLLPADEAGWHRGVDRIHQRAIAFAERLDDRRRMDAGGGAERVGADHRIVRRDRARRTPATPPAVRRQAGEVVVAIAHHHQVDQQQIDRRVAAALADAERGAVQPRGARLERGDARRDAEAAIAVAVPVDADVDAELGDRAT